MDLGWWLSVIIGLGVAGHAAVGIVLTTPLSTKTQPLWQPFGEHQDLLRLNGRLLVLASVLHLAVSWVKAYGASAEVFWSSVAPFPFFAVAGFMELGKPGLWHHVAMAAGFLAFAWHGVAG